ncbi:MAG TPA: ABC transporter ATP-binding protein [Erysipelothrix sp.]|nr:ABC transporter ATP-binding protein [Erysipelothrix sp.]
MKVYFEGFKIKTVIAVLLKFVEACFELLLPLLMVSLINDGILLGNQNHVFKISIVMVLLTVFGYLASITCQYYASIIAQRVGGRIRLDIMQHLLKMDQGVRDQFDHSSMVIRTTTDVDRVQDMIARTIRLAVRAPMIIIGSVFAMYLLNPQLSMILLLSIPVFILVIALFMSLSVRYHKRVQTQWDAFTFKIREFLSGARIIFAFNKSTQEKEAMTSMSKELGKNQSSLSLINSISSPLIAFMMNVLLIALVYIGAIKVQEGIMNSSQILALINYCTQIVLTLIVFMNLVMIFSKGYGSWGRIKEVLETDNVMDKSGHETIDNHDFNLEFIDVNFSYSGENRRVLRDINFKMVSGQTLGIVGLTGSGKSTLLKLIIRMYDAKSGSIAVNGRSIKDYDIQNLKSKVGYIAQKPQFLSGNLQDAIALDSEVDHEAYLKIAQGEDILNKGLDAKVERNANNFSGGQRQRISIARQLAKKPNILLFDDSFSALDTITDKSLRMALDEVDGKLSKVIVSQRTSTILNADNILVMDNGRISAQGNHQELLEMSDLYRKIHTLSNHEVVYD